jgi:hypothetical protein
MFKASLEEAARFRGPPPGTLVRSLVMRTLAAVAGLALMALAIGSSAPLLVKAENPPVNKLVPVADTDTLPQRTTKAFAPFLHAIVQRRMNQAERFFKIRPSLRATLELPETERILARFRKPDEMSLNLIGGRMLGQDIGILLFTVATEDGPVAFKVFYYGYGQDMNIQRMDITDNWDDIERLSSMVDMLPVAVTVPLGGQPIDAAGGQ